MPVAGWRARMVCAAWRPSVVWPGGILMSTITRSGCALDQFQESFGVARLAGHLVPGAFAQAGQALSEQDVVIGEHHASARPPQVSIHGPSSLARPPHCAPNSLPESRGYG